MQEQFCSKYYIFRMMVFMKPAQIKFPVPYYVRAIISLTASCLIMSLSPNHNNFLAHSFLRSSSCSTTLALPLLLRILSCWSLHSRLQKKLPSGISSFSIPMQSRWNHLCLHFVLSQKIMVSSLSVLHKQYS